MSSKLSSIFKIPNIANCLHIKLIIMIMFIAHSTFSKTYRNEERMTLCETYWPKATGSSV